MHVIARACGAIVTDSNGDLIFQNSESKFVRSVITRPIAGVPGGRCFRILRTADDFPTISFGSTSQTRLPSKT